MKKYNCKYRGGYNYTKEYNKKAGWWKKNIEAVNPQQAYEKFLEEVGVYPLDISVGEHWSISPAVWFKDHIDSSEPKANVMESASDIGVQTMDSEKLTSEQLLMNLLHGQQTQINELKKLNFKLMMFWIFLVVLPLLGWLLTQ